MKSWSECDTNGVIWGTLNADWSTYGSVPIQIRFADRALCTGHITYEALAADGADVVILSDSAGGNMIFDADEVEALEQYASEGHDVIGTSLLFHWLNWDNRELAPLFGFPSPVKNPFGIRNVVPTFDVRVPGSPLFRNVANPYVSTSYSFVTQSPPDRRWDSDEFTEAIGVARTAEGRGAISIYESPNYVAIYISTMPEYNGAGTDDIQLFYNAIIYPLTGRTGPARSSSP